MRIFSPENEYTILTRLSDGNRLTALDGAGNLRLLAVSSRPAEAKRLTPILIDWAQNKDFIDFVEFFPHKNGVIAVFACHNNGQPLCNALAEADYPLRAEILRSLFALVLRQNLPSEVLRGVITAENLIVSPGGRVCLMYDLPHRGTEDLYETVNLIAGDCILPELDSFCGKLKDGTFNNHHDMYEAAGRAACSLAEYTPEPKPEELSADGIKARVEAVKALLLERWAILLAMLALLAGYLAVGVMFYYTVIAPPRVDNGIRTIGTVTCDGP